MKCLKTQVELGSLEWRKQSACNCHNCKILFSALRETFQADKILDVRIKEESEKLK